MQKRAIFFDRDGVMVKNVNGEGPTSAKDLELISESITVISKLKEKDYRIFIVSNQPDIALGNIDENNRKALLGKFESLLKENNLSFNEIYYCFHHPKGVVKKYTKNCDCRKPKPGMILKAIQKYNINPIESYMIGDRASDIKAGNSAGVKTLLIDPKNSEQNYLSQYEVSPDFTVKKISEVLEIII